MIKLILADDHQMFREGIKSLLISEGDIQVVGEASDGEELLVEINSLEADIVLLDIEMPKMGGLEVMREFKKKNVEIKVLVLSMHKSPEFVRKIFQAGAAGYLQKDAGKESLLKAIREMQIRGTYFPPELASVLIESLQNKKQGTKISKRELEVINLIVDGLTTKEIAAKLFLSKHTVESHRQNILLKLGLKNSAELVKYALQNGLI
ncbi:MAG: response regulator transcription factor [Bacteroidota bacterium]